MNSKYIYTSYIKQLTPIDEFDTEKLILEVQKRECIWNVYSKSYNLKCIRNRETKKRAWEEVGRAFHLDWDLLTAEDKQKRVEILSKKWANIRKYYTDEVRKSVNSPPKKRQRSYHHLLAFLDDTVHKRRIPRIKEFKNIGNEKITIDSSSDSESGELFIIEDADELAKLSAEKRDPPAAPAQLDDKNKNPDPYLNAKYEVGNSSNLWQNAVISTQTHNEKIGPVTAMAARNPEIMKLLNEPLTSSPDNSSYLKFPPPPPIGNNIYMPVVSTPTLLDQSAEASKRFLLSLLPEIMSLNAKQKLEFRLGIIDLLNDIKLRVNLDLNVTLFPNININ